MATFSVTKGYTFSSGQTVTDVNLNALGTPTVSLNAGSIGLSDIGTGSVDLSKFATGLMEDIHNLLFPVGSVFISTVQNGHPNYGTWLLYSQGRMLLGAGGSFADGSTGGSSTVTTSDHSHTILTGITGQEVNTINGDTNLEANDAGGETLDIMNPYQVVYIYRRTA